MPYTARPSCRSVSLSAAQMLSRAAEQGGAQLRQSGPGIFHDHKRRAARLYLMLSNHGAAARVHSGFRVAVTVGTGSAQTDERLARPGLTGIVNEIGNLRIEIAGEGIGKIFEQILEFHPGPPYPTFIYRKRIHSLTEQQEKHCVSVKADPMPEQSGTAEHKGIPGREPAWAQTGQTRHSRF